VKKTVRRAVSASAGLTYSVPYDTTRFVEVSIKESGRDAADRDGAGVHGRLLFLQSWRATLIPFAAVPVS
jgi:multidrug efflux pump subunit AcrB